jgi:hypothetical protein
MWRIRCAAAVLAAARLFTSVLPSIPVATAEPVETAPVLDQEVRTLLGNLGGPTRAERDDAEKQLIQLGPKVLPLFPPPEQLPTPSVREAVRRIRFELEQTAARESVLPSRITLTEKESVEAAFNEITRQTGNRLDGRSLGKGRLRELVGADAKEACFWPLLDDLAARHHWRYEYDSSGRRLKLMPLEAGTQLPESAVAYAGAFRVQALPVERSPRGVGRPLDKKIGEKPAGQPDDLLRVTLKIMPEPRLRPLFLQVAMREITARAADGTVLKALSPEANLELRLGEGTLATDLHYLVPRTKATPVLGLKGKLPCTTAAGSEAIRFTDLERVNAIRGGSIARRRGGVTVALQRLRLSPTSPRKQEARIQIAVTYDSGGPAFESHRSWILHNEVYLEDADGTPVRLNGESDTTQQGDGSLGIEYRFVDVPDPLPAYTFVYVAPTLIVDVPIEFEIQSVPIKPK